MSSIGARRVAAVFSRRFADECVLLDQCLEFRNRLVEEALFEAALVGRRNLIGGLGEMGGGGEAVGEEAVKAFA